LSKGRGIMEHVIRYLDINEGVVKEFDVSLTEDQIEKAKQHFKEGIDKDLCKTCENYKKKNTILLSSFGSI
jgi:hypothetical protein